MGVVEDGNGQNEKEHEVDPESDFPSLTITLEEARRRYDEEGQRNNSLESKTSMLIGINALIISLASAFLEQGPIVTGFIVLPALFSTYLGLRILEIRDYGRPGKEIGEFYKYAKFDPPAALKDRLLVSYMETVEENKSKNDEKVDDFTVSYWLTLGSIVLIVAIPIVQSIMSTIFQYLGLVLRYLINL